jgi:O-antigen/teichoic acid export membrane protein
MKGIKSNQNNLLLVSGRIYYRLAFLVLTIVLSAVWGKSEFGYYASKMGTWVIIDSILGFGMGISISKLLVLHQSLKEILIRGAILVIVCANLTIIGVISAICLPLSAAFNVDFDMLDIIIICSISTYGISTVFQCIFRVLGKVSYDYIISYITGSFILLLAFISYFIDMSPLSNVIFRALFFVLIDIFMVYKIIKFYPLKKKYNRSFYKTSVVRIIKETVIMGVNNVAVDANYSVINIVFRFCKLFEIAADFNLALAVAGPLIAFYRYLLVIFIPKIVDFAQKGKKYIIGRYAKKFLIIGFITVFVSLACSLITTISATGMIQMFILMVCLFPLLFLFETILMYFEVAMTKHLVFTLRVCLLGFAFCSAFSFLLIPRLGGPGAVFSLFMMYTITITCFLSSFYNKKERNLQ